MQTLDMIPVPEEKAKSENEMGRHWPGCMLQEGNELEPGIRQIVERVEDNLGGDKGICRPKESGMMRGQQQGT